MGVFFAWAIGEGVVFWRWHKLGAPPTPGVLLVSSGLFAGCAAVASYPPARAAATAAAFALDLAVLLQVVGKTPTGTTGWPPPDMDFPQNTILPDGNQSETTAQATTGSNA